MQHVLAPHGIPTPPASPLSWDQHKYLSQQQQHYFQPQPQQPRFVPVAPEDRIGTRLGDSLQLTGIIGTGAYGVVYEAVDIKTNARYAVKALSKFNPDGSPLEPRQLEYQDREIRLHYAASAHPNVVSMLKIIDVYPDCLYVVLEYCPEGDLFYNITECGRFVGKDELARRVFLQILDAVHHLHQLGIYHRDLKPENILVSNRGETLKLADFGLATSAEQSEDYGCGSTFYMSPECLGQSSSTRPFYYCAPNDVWSLGVILVNLTCGRNPWKQASLEDSTYRAYTRNPGFLKTILPVTDELDAILARIFSPNPDQRVTLPELRQLILQCPRLTVQPQMAAAPVVPAVAPVAAVAAIAQSPQVLTPPASPEHPVIVSSSDDTCMTSPADSALSSLASLSPASSVLSLSSARTYTSSISSPMDALVDDDDSDVFCCQDVPEIMTPPPVPCGNVPPTTCLYDEDPSLAAAAAYQQQYLAFHEHNHPALQHQQHQQQQQHHAGMHSPPPVHHLPQQVQVVQPNMSCGMSSRFFLWDWAFGKNAQPAVQQFRAFHPMSILPMTHSVFMPGCH